MTHKTSRRRNNYRVSPVSTAPAVEAASPPERRQRFSGYACPGVKIPVARSAVFMGPRDLLQAVCVSCGRSIFVDVMNDEVALIMDHGAPLPETAEETR